MAKKSSVRIPLIYLLGMLVVTIGFCVPVFKGVFGKYSGFDFVNFDNFNFVTIGALLIFVGAVAGVVFSVVPMKQANVIRLVCILVSIAGGLVLVLNIKFGGKNSIDSVILNQIGKHMLKSAFVGFYMIVAGWVVSLCGAIINK